MSHRTESETPPESRQKLTNKREYMPLFILTAVIVVIGCCASFAAPDGHWMEGPAIAIMISFMPLTAITYLHYRLPQKQEEFDSISRTLGAQNHDAEEFSFALRQDESAADYVLPLFFVSFFSLLGFYILFTNSAVILFDGAEWAANAHEKFGTETFRKNIVSIGMAFLGAYIWSIQYIFRRMMTLDLPPGAYFSVGTRMIYSSFLAVVFQYLLSSLELAESTLLSSQFVVVSFLIGIFPERALSWMRDSLGRVFARPKAAASRLPLEMIEGISGFHKARLLELGIESVQNLAHASLMELILKTPFKPRVLADWMAQARLCLEFKENTNAIRAAGIRTILDLVELFEAEEDQLVSKLAENSRVDIDLIRTVYLANRQEPSLIRLRKAYDVLNII